MALWNLYLSLRKKNTKQVFEQCLLVIYVTVVIPLNLALTTWHMTSMLWFQIISDSVAFIVKFVRVCGPCQPPTMHCTKESRQLRSLESQIVSDLLFCKQTFTRSDFVTSSKESVTRSWHQDIQLATYLKKKHLLYKVFPLFRSHAILWWAMLLGTHGYYPGLSPSCSRSIESAVPNFIWFSLRLENCSQGCVQQIPIECYPFASLCNEVEAGFSPDERPKAKYSYVQIYLNILYKYIFNINKKI